MDPFSLYLGRSDTSLSSLMHPQDGHMCASCRRETMHLQSWLHKSLDLEQDNWTPDKVNKNGQCGWIFFQSFQWLLYGFRNWEVQHSVPYVHTQNGLAESLIKRIKLITRPFLQNCNLPTTCWGHAVLHAADFIQLSPTAYSSASPLQLVHSNLPSISWWGRVLQGHDHTWRMA